MWLIFLFGVAGYLMRKLNYPMAPAVLAIVLGPLAEKAFRQTLIGEHGDVTVFFTRPLSGTFMLLALALFLYPLYLSRKRRKEAAAERGEGA